MSVDKMLNKIGRKDVMENVGPVSTTFKNSINTNDNKSDVNLVRMVSENAPLRVQEIDERLAKIQEEQVRLLSERNVLTKLITVVGEAQILSQIPSEELVQESAVIGIITPNTKF